MKPTVYSATGSQGHPVFRALPAEAFGAKSEAVFPGMGQRAAQGYALSVRAAGAVFVG